MTTERRPLALGRGNSLASRAAVAVPHDGEGKGGGEEVKFGKGIEGGTAFAHFLLNVNERRRSVVADLLDFVAVGPRGELQVHRTDVPVPIAEPVAAAASGGVIVPVAAGLALRQQHDAVPRGLRVGDGPSLLENINGIAILKVSPPVDSE